MIDIILFLFQTGSIRRSNETLLEQKRSVCFYSKLVRLEVGSPIPRAFEIWMFLFQTGSIRSDTAGVVQPAAALGFLFQTGSIRRDRDCERKSHARRRFYSKLVRLEVGLGATNDYRQSRFLFQTGSIRSIFCLDESFVFGQVSIPNWFD